MRTPILLVPVLFAFAASAQSQLTVLVEPNRPADGGTVRMAICPGAEAYEKEKGCRIASGKVQGELVHIVVEDLPEGRYGIKAFHDVNDSGSMDFNLAGIPKEPYGFSNNATGFMSAPKFEDAAFTVKKGKNSVRFKMRG